MKRYCDLVEVSLSVVFLSRMMGAWQPVPARVCASAGCGILRVISGMVHIHVLCCLCKELS